MTPIRIQENKDFLVKINDTFKRIKLEDIVGVKSEGKYVSLVLDNRNYIFRGTLKDLENQLPSNFVRSHSSCIININKLQEVKSKEHMLVLSNNIEFCYSRTYKNNVLKSFLVG